MSNLEKDGLQACLFSGQGQRLINIKFMRGDAKVISTADFRADICSMIHQRDAGQPSGPAQSGREQVDVRNFVGNL